MYSYTLNTFKLSFSPCTQQPLSWDKEVRRAAKLIADSTNKPIWLCLSGGIDSEVVAESFIAEKIPFKALTLSYGGINDHDIAFASSWCQKRRVDQQVVKIDVKDLFANQAPVLFDQGYKAANVFRYIQIKLLQTVESFGGYAVLGGGEQLYRVPAKQALTMDDVYIEVDVGFAAPLIWIEQHQTTHQPYFFYSTSELVKSWLNIPYIKTAIEYPDIFRHPSNLWSIKPSVYRSFFVDQEWRLKYHGFEKIKAFRAKCEEVLQLKFDNFTVDTYKLFVVELLKQLG